jgi:hypothetical protein
MQETSSQLPLVLPFDRPARFKLLRAGTYCAPIGCDRGADLEATMDEEAGHIVETAVEARAGFLDRPTTVVLIVSTTLTIALFAAIYIGFFAR